MRSPWGSRSSFRIRSSRSADGNSEPTETSFRFLISSVSLHRIGPHGTRPHGPVLVLYPCALRFLHDVRALLSLRNISAQRRCLCCSCGCIAFVVASAMPVTLHCFVQLCDLFARAVLCVRNGSLPWCWPLLSFSSFQVSVWPMLSSSISQAGLLTDYCYYSSPVSRLTLFCTISCGCAF